MLQLHVRNVRQALPRALRLAHGFSSTITQSRNGPVIRLPGVFSVQYERPWERVLLDPIRDANPFFHLFESLWMLQGRNDLSFIQRFVSNFDQYSDDGKILWGAYGHRWRNHFGYDQIAHVIDVLKTDPVSRRCVIQMWDARIDGKANGKDYPCNIDCTVQIEDGYLNLTVYNRSNDIVFGMLGANAVHFSFLQEYIARALRLPMGTLTQVSSNAHVYVDKHAALMESMLTPRVTDYADCVVDHTGLDVYFNEMEFSCLPVVDLDDVIQWDDEVARLLETLSPGTFMSPSHFLRDTAGVMLTVHDEFKRGNRGEALNLCSRISAPDWRLASQEWIERRMPK